MDLSTPIEKIPRIGSAYQKKLKKLGIKTVLDLLFHFPHRYEDFSKITPIAKLSLQQDYCVQGKILEIENSRTWKKRMILTQAIVEDKTGAIKVIWFNQPYLIKTLKPQDGVCLAGKVVLGGASKRGYPEMYLANPAYEKISLSVLGKKDLSQTDLIHTGRLVPVYPETERLSSRWFRYILKPLLVNFRDKIPEALPPAIIRENQLLPISKAIWQIHFPDSMALAEKAQARFSFEELFNLSLLALRERQKLNKEKAIDISPDLERLREFVRSLPFKLTDSQKKSAWQILKDLEKPRPMNRLLEGDVGSGKTVVAMMAGLTVAKAGFQVAFMAPTEILAKQHFQEVERYLKNFNLNIGLMTGKEDKYFSKKLKNEVIEISRRKLLEKTKDGGIDILIGTHALIQDKVKFGKLALVILDEQHRFGVEQRARLCSAESGTTAGKARQDSEGRPIPHLLSMTATPIPRTLALTIYGDLDLSLIKELPKGRKKIITEVISPEKRKEAYNFIKKQVKKGRQVFVICPRIEGQSSDVNSLAQPVSSNVKRQTINETGSDKRQMKNEKQVLSWAEVKAVKEEYEKLSKDVFPDLRVAMLHGKMATKEKEKIMKEFKAGKIDILVSTSVIEVGIDVPNAAVMMIEGAERFGLAQLHQFRGRVGRSKYQSFCFLFTDSPARKTNLRLKALLSCEDGFALAEKDLEIRGPGAITGQRQWGIPDLAMSSLKDVFLVEKVRVAAKKLLEEDPELKKYPLLRERLERFKERIHLE